MLRERLLLDKLKLVGTNAANGADVILRKLGGVNLDLVAANDAYELVLLLLGPDDLPFVGDERMA